MALHLLLREGTFDDQEIGVCRESRKGGRVVGIARENDAFPPFFDAHPDTLFPVDHRGGHERDRTDAHGIPGHGFHCQAIVDRNYPGIQAGEPSEEEPYPPPADEKQVFLPLPLSIVAGEEECGEVDGMVGMKMGEDDYIDIVHVITGLQKSSDHGGPHIDQYVSRRGGEQTGGRRSSQGGRRGARAKDFDLHGSSIIDRECKRKGEGANVGENTNSY